MFNASLAATVTPARHRLGALIGLVISSWASFTFFRGSVTGAPPLYSKGPLQRTLHFVAGIIFAALALEIGVMLAHK
jgi:hypothetical protein